MPNPIEPGKIPGQNPKTPQRLPSHTGDLSGSGRGGALIYAIIILAILIGLVFFLL